MLEERRKEVAKLIARISPNLTDTWCTKQFCYCTGCINKCAGLQDKVSYEEWLDWKNTK